jgi:WD40 repeat protein
MDGSLVFWELSTGKILRLVEKAHRTSWVQAVAFRQDDGQVVSVGNNRRVKVWDAYSGRVIRSFKGTWAWMEHWANTSVAFSKDGRLVLLDSMDTQIWDVETGQNVMSLPGRSTVLVRDVADAAFSPDGSSFVIGGWGLEFWELTSGQQKKTFQGLSWNIQALDYAPDGQTLVTAGKDGTLTLWDLSTGKEILTFARESGSVHKIRYSPDGQYVLSAKNSGELTLHSTSTGRQVRMFKSESLEISALAASPDIRLALAGAKDGSLTLWDLNRGTRVKTFKGHRQSVTSLAYSGDGKLVLSGSAAGTVRLWDMVTGKGRRTLQGHRAAVTSVAFSPDSRLALTGSKDQTCRLWDLDSGNEIKTFQGHTHWVNAVAFSPNGRYILSGGSDSTVKLWELKTGRIVHSFDNEEEWVQSLAVSPDGRYVLAGGWQDFALWETATRRKVRSFKGHTGNITGLAVSSNGERIASCSDDHGVKLWNARTGEEIFSFTGHRDEVLSVVFSKDDRYVLSGGADMTTRIWSADTGLEIVRMVSSRDGEWIVVTPDGYYDTSLEGGTLLHWVYPGGMETFTFEQFESRFKRADIIKARLAGDIEAGRPAPELTQPPRIEISSLSDEHETEAKSYQLTLTATAQKAVRSVRVFTNGKPATEVSLDRKKETLSLEVPLFAGANRITAIAYDEKGFSSNPHFLDVICRARDITRPTLHVLGIGISAYPNLPAKWQLAFAHSDAQSVVTALKGQRGQLFGKVEPRLLVNEQATTRKIGAALESLGAASENDVVMIFMAGHGIRGNDGVFYFLTSEGQLDSPSRGGISWASLGQHLDNIKGRTILMLDACHSGSIVTETVVPNDELARDFFSGRRGGVMVFSASKGRQYSYESPDFGGGAGLFTYALTQAIGAQSQVADRDKNGYVELLELVDYVSGYVDRQTFGQQTPWLSRKELFGDLPVAAVVN